MSGNVYAKKEEKMKKENDIRLKNKGARKEEKKV